VGVLETFFLLFPIFSVSFLTLTKKTDAKMLKPPQSKIGGMHETLRL
jgi:hypothetical protein